jgi:hypothetical protein
MTILTVDEARNRTRKRIESGDRIQAVHKLYSGVATLFRYTSFSPMSSFTEGVAFILPVDAGRDGHEVTHSTTSFV